MRLLVPVVSLIVAASPVFAQSKPTPTTRPTNQNAVSATVVQLYDGSGTVDAETGKKILGSPKLRAEVEKTLANAKAFEEGCFTMRIYAPQGEKAAPAKFPSEKPYVPRPFQLQSTCTNAARIEQVPAELKLLRNGDTQ
jgi:hypothetical protein